MSEQLIRAAVLDKDTCPTCRDMNESLLEQPYRISEFPPNYCEYSGDENEERECSCVVRKEETCRTR